MVTHVDKRTSRISNRARKMRTRARDTRREIERIANTATLGGLFLSFLKIGTVGFGGGLAVIAHIRSVVVGQRRWLSEQEFASGFALAQTLPGTSAGNMATYVGLRLRGWRGAGVAHRRLHPAFDADDDYVGDSLTGILAICPIPAVSLAD